ncbi:hypothetical protein [uncultured Desulfosarcina sp.]|nr:hypothetical protein [uncultured Desulfosarcina sp.]
MKVGSTAIIPMLLQRFEVAIDLSTRLKMVIERTVIATIGLTCLMQKMVD